MSFKTKLIDNFVSLPTTFSLQAYFKLNWVFLCILALQGTANLYNSNQIQPNTLVVLFISLEHILTQSKQISNFLFSFFSFLFFFFFFFLHFCRSFGSTWTLQTMYRIQGKGFLWIDFIFFSSMALYNHPLYFKSGEINSC